jgi:hypothetical protein
MAERPENSTEHQVMYDEWIILLEKNKRTNYIVKNDLSQVSLAH